MKEIFRIYKVILHLFWTVMESLYCKSYDEWQQKRKNCVEKLFPITSNFWQLFIYMSRRPLSHYEYAGKFFRHRKQKASFAILKILSRTHDCKLSFPVGSFIDLRSGFILWGMADEFLHVDYPNFDARGKYCSRCMHHNKSTWALLSRSTSTMRTQTFRSCCRLAEGGSSWRTLSNTLLIWSSLMSRSLNPWHEKNSSDNSVWLD